MGELDKKRPIRRFVPAGTEIFGEGEPGDCAYVIECGSVEVSTRRDGERMVIARYGAGEIFGEMAILDRRPRSASVTAVDDCQLLIFSAEQIQDRLKSLDPVLHMIMTVMLDRFRDTMARLRNETVEPRETRSIPDLTIHPGRQVFRQAIERIDLEQSLKLALEREELVLFFQPLISCHSGRIESFEALVRWEHPTRGLLGPDQFIDAAEQSGQIVQITSYVIERACRAVKLLREASANSALPVENLCVSVNVTVRDLGDPAFLDRLVATLDRYEVEPRWLTLEVTESMLMENADSTLAVLDRCQGIGLSISIDDFGTGYSSLSYLHRFPFETLKIDRSFVQNLSERNDGTKIINAMIALGQGLGMEVVAEGIEDPGQATTLRHFGCDYWQGYLFSRPVPLDEALVFTRDWQGLPEADEEARPALPQPNGQALKSALA